MRTTPLLRDDSEAMLPNCLYADSIFAGLFSMPLWFSALATLLYLRDDDGPRRAADCCRFSII